MRFIGYQDQTRRMIGRVTPDGKVVPVADIETFYSNLNHWTRQSGDPSRALNLSGIDEVPAVPAGAAVFCVGLNYRAHAAEVNRELSERPIIFGRWTRSLAVNGTPVPAVDEKL